MALGPGEQVSHPETGETARFMQRQDLTRSPWQTFRYDSDGCIACVGQPTLVLTGTAATCGIMYLHRKCDELMRQGLQQWEPMETRQSLPLSPGELPRTLCQLRLQHHSFYVDFNMLQQACEPPIMYPLRDKPNQLLHLEPQTLRILHLSDTHSLHREILELPAADLLLHTGDFTISGTDAEYRDFDGWIGYWKNVERVKHCVAIAGNHEFHHPTNEIRAGKLTHAAVLDPNYVRSRLRNATFLAHEQVVFDGLRIFGSTWEPYSDGCCPDNHPPTEQPVWAAYCSSNPCACVHKFDRIPAGTHLLMTHGPASGVLDWEAPGHAYGSSAALRQRIIDCGVRAHLFGHIHEQRGVLVKNAHGVYEGGVEYRNPQSPHTPYPAPGAPPPTYPCDIISNNAVKNNSRHEDDDKPEKKKHYIAGAPRMIIAHRQPGPAAAGAACSWRFRLPNAQQ